MHFQQHIHEKILNTFSTNFIPFFFNLNWVELKLNLIIELNWNWIQIPINVFEFNLRILIWFNLNSKLHCNVVHTSIPYNNELVFFISRILKNIFPQRYLFFPYFLMFLVLVQIKRIYYMLHIASYHYYPLAKIKVIPTCHVIDIWKYVV